MTHEQYQERGYQAVDYYSLSQWQRLRGLWFTWRHGHGFQCVVIPRVWKDDYEGDYFARGWWRRQAWGLHSSQNGTHLCFGPFELFFVLK